jgi:hypothetical protein
MSDKKPIYNTKAVYTGRRFGRDGKVRHRFEKANGEELNFRGIKGVCLGYTYKCSASTIAERPERTDDDRIDNPEWEAADAMVGAYNAQKRAEAKMRKEAKPALRAAVLALKPLLKGKDYFGRRALIEYLVELTRK